MFYIKLTYVAFSSLRYDYLKEKKYIYIVTIFISNKI